VGGTAGDPDEVLVDVLAGNDDTDLDAALRRVTRACTPPPDAGFAQRTTRTRPD
jgi:hypothetical protein